MMPKKKDPYTTPTQRALALHSLLVLSGREYSLSRLAKLLDCSKQTVLRMMEQLGLNPHVTIESRYDARQRWFRATSNGHGKDPALTEESVHILRMCRDMVFHLLPDRARAEIDGMISAGPAPAAQSLKPEPAPASVVVPRLRGRIDYGPHQKALETLLDAIRERRVCRVAYRAPNRAEAKQYRLGPLRLLTYNEALYLSAQLIPAPGDKTYTDPLLFAVHRFEQVARTKNAFTPHPANTEPGHAFGLGGDDGFDATIRFASDVAGDLKLSYAQFEELERFSRYGARLEKEKQKTLDRGRRVREMLKQLLYSPLAPGEQMAVLIAVTEGLMDGIPTEKTAEAEGLIREGVASRCGEVIERVEKGEALADADQSALRDAAEAALKPINEAVGDGND